MKLYLIRHGQSLANITGINDPNSPLTHDGILQCKRLNKKLESMHITFDKVLVSSLLRAQQSFEYMFHEIKFEQSETLPELREFESYPNQAEPQETEAGFEQRVATFISEIMVPSIRKTKKNQTTTTIAIVSHAFWCQEFVKQILHLPKRSDAQLLRNAEFSVWNLS